VRRFLAFVTAVVPIIVFCNREPGQYLGTCDGVPMMCSVDADGTLDVECWSVDLVRMAEGITARCEAVEEAR